MSSSQNALAQVTNPVQQNHGPTDPSQSAGPQRNLDPHEETTAETESLPPGWEERHTSGGRAYYSNHDTKTTTWMRPSTTKAIEGESLPPGWEEWHTSEGRAYYVDHKTKSKTWTPHWIKAIESIPLPPGWEERYTPGGSVFYMNHHTETTYERPSAKKAIKSGPLPPGWEEWHTSEGRAFYVDHNTKGKTWTPPWIKKAIESIPLPLGWEERYTPEGRAYYVDHNTKNTTWAMPASGILQRIYSLDASSPDFLHRLYCLVHYDEVDQCLTSLQGSELARLVDFLDKVRAVLSTFHQFTKQTPQALGAIPTTYDVARECLNKLQAICGHHAILPSPYIASGQIARAGDGPIAHGVIADVWEGVYRSEKVSIKCLKIPTENDQTLKKVRIRYGTSSSRLLKNTAVILQRGGHLEKAKAPEHRLFHRCYDRSFANNLGVDAERNSDGVRREKSRRESDRPGESFPVIALDR